jgi:2-polyprenyl-3-methyl-5-hydroxy-6-metoxy-1,4-benzoquinol methylase
MPYKRETSFLKGGRFSSTRGTGGIEISQFRPMRWLSLIILGLISLFLLWQAVLRVALRRWVDKEDKSHTPPRFVILMLNAPLRCWLFGTPKQTVDRSGMIPGMGVLEIGPGSGSFTVPLGRRVAAQGKEGRVTSLEHQSQMIVLLGQRLQGAQVTNVDILQDDEQQMSLPENSFDLVFLVTMLGETADPLVFVRECARVLRPVEMLAVTEQLIDSEAAFTCPKYIHETFLALEPLPVRTFP